MAASEHLNAAIGEPYQKRRTCPECGFKHLSDKHALCDRCRYSRMRARRHAKWLAEQFEFRFVRTHSLKRTTP